MANIAYHVVQKTRGRDYRGGQTNAIPPRFVPPRLAATRKIAFVVINRNHDVRYTIEGNYIIYMETLDSISLTRYKEKIADIGSLDPYQLPSSDLISDFADLPSTQNEDIVEYLVFRKSKYTMTEFKAMKSLQAHNQLTSGFVHDLKVFVPQQPNIGNRLVLAKVYHSQRMNDKPLEPWFIADPSGKVLSAHFTCVAGLGETCSLVATILFTVDVANKIKENRSVTDVCPYWGQPAFKSVAYANGAAIDFTSANCRKGQLDASLLPDPSPQTPVSNSTAKRARLDIQPTSAEELKEFFNSIQFNNSKVKPAVLSVLEGYSDSYIQKNLAPVLHEVVDNVDNILPSEALRQIIKDLLLSNKLKLEEINCKIIEQKTREQAKCMLWHRLRAGRITSSNLHKVCHTDINHPSITLLRDITSTSSCTKTPAMKWGLEKELVARQQYGEEKSKVHQEFAVRQSGLVLCPDYPFMAASPDGISSCKCCGTGCVEIKCPFTLRDMTIREAFLLKKPDFPLNMNGDSLSQKISHAYYSQIQCQIYLTKSNYCDFVLWTNKEMFVQRIYPDFSFWTQASTKANKFFEDVVLPELICNQFSRIHMAAQSTTTSSNDLPLSPARPEDGQKSQFWCYCHSFGVIVEGWNQKI